MKDKLTRGLVTLYIMIFLTLVIEPFIMLLIQSRTCSLRIAIDGQTFKANGFIKSIEDSEKETSYLIGNPLGYFPFTGGLAGSTLIEISRTQSDKIPSTPGKYALYESWTGMENGEQLLHVLFQCTTGEYVQLSFYGKSTTALKERVSLIKQIDKQKYIQVPYSELAKPFMRAYMSRILKRLKHSDFEDKTFIEFDKAVDNADLSKVKELLNNSESKNTKNSQGYSLLHIACLNSNDVDVIKSLVENGVSINMKSSEGFTPLMLAVFSGRDDGIIETLLADGAAINLTNNSEENALHLACYAGNADMAAMLLHAGASHEQKDELGLTPLHEACYFGYSDVVKLLLKAGANVDVRNLNGLTPLHLAAIGGDFETIRLLVEAGANTRAIDNQGMTCLHKAAYNANSKAVIYLANDRELVNIKDNKGKTAYDYGKLSGMGK